MTRDVRGIENDVGIGLSSYHNLSSREGMYLNLTRKSNPSQINRTHVAHHELLPGV